MYPSLENVSCKIQQHIGASDIGAAAPGGRSPALAASLDSGITAPVGASGPIQRPTQRHLGRLTFASAAEALSDDAFRHAANGSWAKVQARVWQTGSLARSIESINNRTVGAQDPHENLVVWRQCFARNTGGFRDVSLAMLDVLNDQHPDYFIRLEEKPFFAPPSVSVDEVHRRYKQRVS